MLFDQKTVIVVEGMMCAHCAQHVEEACKSVQGVHSAKVNLQEKNVLVKGRDVNVDEVKAAIKAAGYRPQ